MIEHAVRLEILQNMHPAPYSRLYTINLKPPENCIMVNNGGPALLIVVTDGRSLELPTHWPFRHKGGIQFIPILTFGDRGWLKAGDIPQIGPGVYRLKGYGQGFRPMIATRIGNLKQYWNWSKCRDFTTKEHHA